MKSNTSCTDTTKTPRTDALMHLLAGIELTMPSLLDHARQLEEELIALREFTDAHLRLCKGENNL